MSAALKIVKVDARGLFAEFTNQHMTGKRYAYPWRSSVRQRTV